jgi:23S rRNA pseudouridine2605 synthase
MATERLQKIIANAGIASRRKAEELISAGAVTVNGQVVTELGTKADPDVDYVKVNGKLLRGTQKNIYVMLNKPKGYVTTVSDPEGRPTVMQLLDQGTRGVHARVYPVGRLDYASEGLLLLTNDGDLANKLTRAASHVPKTYVVKVSGMPKQEAIEKLRGGVMIREEKRSAGAHTERAPHKVRTAPARIQLLKEADNPWLEVTLIEGRNRQIRKMFEEVGHRVEKIRRVRYGPLKLDVEPGKFRMLDAREVERLKSAVDGPKRAPVRGVASEAAKPRSRSRRR